MAQEILTTFTEEVGAVTLKPGEISGRYTIHVNDAEVFDRKKYGGFADMKEIKQMIRDIVAPGKKLGHSDSPAH